MARARNRRMKSKLIALNMDRQKRAVEQLLQDQQNELIPHLKMLEELSKAKKMTFGEQVLLEVEGQLVAGTIKCKRPDGSVDVITDKGETHVFCDMSRVVLPKPAPVQVPAPAAIPIQAIQPIATPVYMFPHLGNVISFFPPRPLYEPMIPCCPVY